jgi:hypothetical protein
MMRQLSRVQNAIFLVGGLLMVIGAGLSLFRFAVAPYIYALGAIGFASMQMLQRYDGQNFVIRRLRRIMVLSDVLFLVAAVLMFASQGNPLGLDQITYVQYVYQKWVVILLIAAVLQLYTTHRIANELEKEAKKR